jgi:F0F1-type ATP synthase membrane subunit a
MMSGHALLKILIGFAWAMLCSGNILAIFLAALPWVVVTLVTGLELMIAFLQAYVFVLLITLYINDILTFHS